MYGSFGSYSSMGIGSLPMSSTSSVTSRDESCAFPSWPRRASLSSPSSSSSSSTAYEPRASAYLSDDDLFLSDEPSGSESGDDVCCRSSVASVSASPPLVSVDLVSPLRSPPSEAEMLDAQRQRSNMRKDLIRMVQQEKERRKQQASKSRRAAASKKSSRPYAMAPITEAEE